MADYAPFCSVLFRVVGPCKFYTAPAGEGKGVKLACNLLMFTKNMHIYPNPIEAMERRKRKLSSFFFYNWKAEMLVLT